MRSLSEVSYLLASAPRDEPTNRRKPLMPGSFAPEAREVLCKSIIMHFGRERTIFYNACGGLSDRDLFGSFRALRPGGKTVADSA